MRDRVLLCVLHLMHVYCVFQSFLGPHTSQGFLLFYIFFLPLFNYSIKNKLFNNDGLPQPNPPLTRTTVRHPMGHPITAGCDTARDQTRVCIDTSSTDMQCLIPLCHRGASCCYRLQLRMMKILSSGIWITSHSFTHIYSNSRPR